MMEERTAKCLRCGTEARLIGTPVQAPMLAPGWAHFELLAAHNCPAVVEEITPGTPEWDESEIALYGRVGKETNE